MKKKTQPKRAVAFIDGQNLYHGARDAFGIRYPNYDPLALARMVCRKRGWTLSEVRLYTGIPSREQDEFWHEFWKKKIETARSSNLPELVIFSRELRYTSSSVRLPDGSNQTLAVGREKGIDVRLALDMVRLAREQKYDIGIIFSQDQDFSEVIQEVRAVAVDQGREIILASAFPKNPIPQKNRGIMKTDWVLFSRREYHQCLDPNDYRAQSRPQAQAPEPAGQSAQDNSLPPGIYLMTAKVSPPEPSAGRPSPLQAKAKANSPQNHLKAKGRTKLKTKSSQPVDSPESVAPKPAAKGQGPKAVSARAAKAPAPKERQVKTEPVKAETEKPRAAKAQSSRSRAAKVKTAAGPAPKEQGLLLPAEPVKAEAKKPKAPVAKAKTEAPSGKKPAPKAAATVKPQAAKPQLKAAPAAKAEVTKAAPQPQPVPQAKAVPAAPAENSEAKTQIQAEAVNASPSQGAQPGKKPGYQPFWKNRKKNRPQNQVGNEPPKTAPAVPAAPVVKAAERPPAPKAQPQPQAQAQPRPRPANQGGFNRPSGQPAPGIKAAEKPQNVQPRPANQGGFNQPSSQPGTGKFWKDRRQGNQQGGGGRFASNGNNRSLAGGNQNQGFNRNHNNHSWGNQPARRFDTERADLSRELPPPSGFPDHIANRPSTMGGAVKKTSAK